MAQVLKIAGLLAAVVVAGLALGWLGSGGRHGTPETAILTPALPASAPQAGAPSAPSTPPASQPVPNEPRVSAPEPVTHPSPEMTRSASTNGIITQWADRVDDILAANGTEADKAKQLLALFPRLPVEGQAEVARHVANLVADEDYASLSPHLLDPKLSEFVLEVLVGDVLNRPNSIKLPLLLAIAREPQHPKAAEAREILELFLEQDYGANWSLWQAKVEQWLKDNPD